MGSLHPSLHQPLPGEGWHLGGGIGAGSYPTFSSWHIHSAAAISPHRKRCGRRRAARDPGPLPPLSYSQATPRCSDSSECARLPPLLAWAHPVAWAGWRTPSSAHCPSSLRALRVSLKTELTGLVCEGFSILCLPRSHLSPPPGAPSGRPTPSQGRVDDG